MDKLNKDLEKLKGLENKRKKIEKRKEYLKDILYSNKHKDYSTGEIFFLDRSHSVRYQKEQLYMNLEINHLQLMDTIDEINKILILMNTNLPIDINRHIVEYL
jgi:hypothetical protein